MLLKGGGVTPDIFKLFQTYFYISMSQEHNMGLRTLILNQDTEMHIFALYWLLFCKTGIFHFKFHNK